MILLQYDSDNLPYEKVGKNEPVCIADEVPFDIPDSWEWVRLGHVCEIARGGSPRPIKAFLTEDPNGINWIKIGDTDKGEKYINSTKERIIPEGVSKSRMVHAGDFLLTNSMSFGRPYILNVDGCIHDGWLVLSGYNCAYDQDFLFHMLASRFAYFQFCDVVSGAVVKNLNSDKVAAALFPLPPLSEQKRIVEAIESVIPSVNEYDVAESLLSNLTSSFPDRLKKSILQWAIKGKLVPQDPTDEPAEVLLARIREEKARLVKEGKIKKDKHESFIFRRDNSHYEKLDGIERCIDDEIIFEIPDLWTWTRLGSVISLLSGTDFPPDKFNDSVKGIPYITGSSNINGTKIIVNRWTEEPRQIARKGDVLLICKGSGYGKTVICNVEQAHIARQIMAIQNCSLLNMQFIKIFLDSNFAFLKSQGQGVIPGINRESVLNLLLPLPPLNEQKRIVQCITETLPLIEGL